MGRAHDVINQIEQIHSMKAVSQGLSSVQEQLAGHILESQMGFKTIGQTIRKFSDDAECRQNAAAMLGNMLEESQKT